MTSDTPDGEKFVNEDWFTAFMRARRNEAASLAMTAAGLIVVVSVITHHPFDASGNVDGPGAPVNVLGPFGAFIADLALQWLGWAGAALGVMLCAWGLTMLFRGPRRRGPKIVSLRAMAGLLAVIGLATGASSLPIPANWPFAVGLGGVIGDAAHSEISLWLNALSIPFPEVLAGLLGLAGAVIGLFTGYGVTPDDVADAADSAGRLAETAAERARRAVERFTKRVNAEIVSLEPVEAPENRQLPHPTVRGAAKAAGAGVNLMAEAARRAAGRLRPQEAAATDAAARSEPAAGATTSPRVAPAPRATPATTAVAPRSLSVDAFTLPDISLLEPPAPRHNAEDEADLEDRAAQLERVLLDFGVKGEIVAARPGPVVTLFEFEPAPGVRAARVIGLAEDIARSLAAQSARVAVVPGSTVIGIELPTPARQTVYLSGLLDSEPYRSRKAALPLALGETIGGEPFVADLARMPHLLIAGTTGSGKSVGINAMILSLMFHLPPDRCRFLMVDPKMLELSVYDGIPHLLSPVLTDPKKAVAALKWTVREMERRYALMSKLGVRNIASYNRRAEEALAAGYDHLEATQQQAYDQETGQPKLDLEPIPAEIMPYIVVVIDEMADLMLVAGKDIESLVQRLAQMARAAGIHLITATQRPSVDVITGTIKANFPTRISYMVTSKVDSRTILGEQGAEQLLGMGDLLFMAGGGRIRRLHGPFVADEEVETIAQYFRAQGAPEYIEGIDDDPDEAPADAVGPAAGPQGNDLYDQAVYVVTTQRRASTSYLQRQLSIGYNRAANLMDRLEAEGVVSAPNHAGKREVLAAPPPQVANGEM